MLNSKQFLLIFFSFSFIFIFGCFKDDQYSLSDEEISQDYKVDLRSLSLNSGIQLIQIGNHFMLEFPNQQSFDSLVLELDSIQENRDDLFLANNPTLTDDQLDSLEIVLDYNYKQPLINFENQLNFTNSYRLIFEEGEEDYLDGLSTIDPEEQTIMDETEHSLINDKQRVKIGSIIYQYLPDGIVEITDNYEYNLDLIDRFGVDNVNSNGIIVNRANVCRWWVGKSVSEVYNNGSHRVRLKVIFRGGLLDTRVKSKIINFKDKGGENGTKWKRSRAHIGTSNHLEGYLDECTNLMFGQFSGWKNKRRKKVKKNNRVWHAPAIHSIRKYDVYAHFKFGPYGTSFPNSPYQLNLTW